MYFSLKLWHSMIHGSIVVVVSPDMVVVFYDVVTPNGEDSLPLAGEHKLCSEWGSGFERGREIKAKRVDCIGGVKIFTQYKSRIKSLLNWSRMLNDAKILVSAL